MNSTSRNCGSAASCAVTATAAGWPVDGSKVRVHRIAPPTLISPAATPLNAVAPNMLPGSAKRAAEPAAAPINIARNADRSVIVASPDIPRIPGAAGSNFPYYLGARPSNSQQAGVLEFYCVMAHQAGVIQQFCPVECIILSSSELLGRAPRAPQQRV